MVNGLRTEASTVAQFPKREDGTPSFAAQGRSNPINPFFFIIMEHVYGPTFFLKSLCI